MTLPMTPSPAQLQAASKKAVSTQAPTCLQHHDNDRLPSLHSLALHVPRAPVNGGQPQARDEIIVICKLGHLAAVVKQLVNNLQTVGK